MCLVVLGQSAVADAAHLVLGIAVIGIPGVVGVFHVEDNGVGWRTILLSSSTLENLSLLDGSYDPATGTVSLNMDFDAPFTVTLTK